MNRLDADDLIRAVAHQAGLRVAGCKGLGERLGQVIEALDPDRALGAEDFQAARAQLIRVLMARTRLEADRLRIPQIADVKIERPIFVIGYMRSGTTVLHSLLAEDPQCRAPQWWQTHEPSPPPGEMPVAPGRIEAAARDLGQLLQKAPGLLTMHPYWDKGPASLIEDDEIFALDFRSTYPTLFYRVPTLRVPLQMEDPAGAYAFHKQFLQHLQWNQPGCHWVTKGVLHQFFLKWLFEAYPDALCIWPHREPVEILASSLAIVSVLYSGLDRGRTDWRHYAQGFAEGMVQAMTGVLDDPLVNDPRVIHLSFKEVMSSPREALRKLHARTGMEWSRSYETRVAAWLAAPENRPDRYGRYPYSLENFGLDPAAIHPRFRRYRERFGL